MPMNKKIIAVGCAIGLGLILILFAIPKMNSTDETVSSADQLSQETDADKVPQQTDADKVPQQTDNEESVKKEGSLHQEVSQDQNAEHSESGQTVTEKTQSETQSEDDGITYGPEGMELSPEQIDDVNSGDEGQNQQEQVHNDQQQTPDGNEQHSEIGSTESQNDPQSKEVELPAIPIR